MKHSNPLKGFGAYRDHTYWPIIQRIWVDSIKQQLLHFNLSKKGTCIDEKDLWNNKNYRLMEGTHLENMEGRPSGPALVSG